MAGNLNHSSRLHTNIARFSQSFRDGAQVIRLEARQQLQKVRKAPKWIVLLNTIYHQYGLKHLLLIIILIAYQFIGAGIFYFCEVSFDESRELKWKEDVLSNRTEFIQQLLYVLFNSSEYHTFVTSDQSLKISAFLNRKLIAYETQLGIKYTDQKIKWDFWNAMLYAQTICTTIGYGHLYPSTKLGKVFTMLYAIIGIPLVLSILDDLGKLLTRCLKTPWYLTKCGCRRIFRYCTKQSLADIQKLNAEDKEHLEVFDLPIPVAIFVVIGWLFVCSATFCIWEHNWDYFVAFYFFFISLSTIGLGDITPSQPKYLLTLFIYIIIGLSLVSMCINLIQAKMERTYEAGYNQFETLNALSPDHSVSQIDFSNEFARIKRQSSSLGVLRSSSNHYLSRDAVQAFLRSKKRSNKSTQTVLSFPIFSNNAQLTRGVSNPKIRFLPRTLSVDDVMKLVDTEEGDILVLTELARDESITSECSMISDFSGCQTHVQKAVDVSCSPTTTNSSVFPKAESVQLSSKKTFAPVSQDSRSKITSSPSINELEVMEEIEDKILLGRAAKFNSSSCVHFRSRLSLIPEQQSLCEDCEKEEDDSAMPVLTTTNLLPDGTFKKLPTAAQRKSGPNDDKCTKHLIHDITESHKTRRRVNNKQPEA